MKAQLTCYHGALKDEGVGVRCLLWIPVVQLQQDSCYKNYTPSKATDKAVQKHGERYKDFDIETCRERERESARLCAPVCECACVCIYVCVCMFVFVFAFVCGCVRASSPLRVFLCLIWFV